MLSIRDDSVVIVHARTERSGTPSAECHYGKKMPDSSKRKRAAKLCKYMLCFYQRQCFERGRKRASHWQRSPHCRNISGRLRALAKTALKGVSRGLRVTPALDCRQGGFDMIFLGQDSHVAERSKNRAERTGKYAITFTDHRE